MTTLLGTPLRRLIVLCTLAASLAGCAGTALQGSPLTPAQKADQERNLMYFAGGA
jgi:hypothetical protein